VLKAQLRLRNNHISRLTVSHRPSHNNIHRHNHAALAAGSLLLRRMPAVSAVVDMQAPHHVPAVLAADTQILRLVLPAAAVVAVNLMAVANHVQPVAVTGIIHNKFLL